MTRFDRKVLTYIAAVWAALALGGFFMLRSAQILRLAAAEMGQAQLAPGRFEGMQHSLAGLIVFIIVCGVLATLVMGVLFWFVHREMQRRVKAVFELEQSNWELTCFDSLVETLQGCQSEAEIAETARPLLAALFPDRSGSLALVDAQSGPLRQVLAFGKAGYFKVSYEQAACWCLRRGHAHYDDGHSGMGCAHLDKPEGAATFCVPLMPRGLLVGVLTLLCEGQGSNEQEDTRRRLAGRVAEQVGLALFSLRVHDKLLEQSKVDPLTGLFNRRHMKEAFEHERRRQGPVAVRFGLIMADIDHFKQFNDRYGHEAGDLVLKAISAALRASVRPVDIVSRHGGEEMVLICPGLSLAETLACAEHCRQAVAALSLNHGGEELGRLTISLGVAVYPQDGPSLDDLVRVADEGLYRAKHAGRDCVGEHLALPGRAAA